MISKIFFPYLSSRFQKLYKMEQTPKKTAFNKMLTECYSFLSKYAFSLTCNPEDAADLVQDVMLRALQNYDKFNGSVENIRAWLSTMMRNCFINDYNKKNHRRIAAGAMPLPAYSCNNDGVNKLNVQDLQKMGNNINPIFKQTFGLLIHGFKYEEIAGIMHQKLGTVKSRVHFARQAYQEKILQISTRA